jgi:hypothetical protein
VLNRIQRWIVFLLFCGFTLAFACTELYVIYSIVEKGFSGAKVVSGFLAGGLLVGCGRLFIVLIQRNFLARNILSTDRLHRFSAERCTIIENAHRSQEDVYLTRRELVTNTLRFLEECLNGWVLGSHFELCVFVDPELPLLFAYFDSNHKTSSRSMNEREHNPRYYVEKNYEVTKLLQAPTSHPRVIKDTRLAKAKYNFTSSQQREQVVSSILICLDLTAPCALVVSSNKKNAFPEGDSEIWQFVRYVGELVRYDLIEGNLVRQIRKLRPKLFEVA